MGLDIASPKAQQEIAKMIEEGKVGGKALTQQGLQQEVQKRLEGTSEMIESTSKQEYLQSIHELSDANKDAAVVVNKLRETIQTIVDKGYELGESGVKRFFGVELGPMVPTEKGYN